jgi:hypothetical protein
MAVLEYVSGSNSSKFKKFPSSPKPTERNLRQHNCNVYILSLTLIHHSERDYVSFFSVKQDKTIISGRRYETEIKGHWCYVKE